MNTTNFYKNNTSYRAAANEQAVENRNLSWRLFLTTVISIIVVITTILFLPGWLFKVPFVLLLGLLQVRLFCFYHDYLHKAQFNNSRVANFLMWLVGFYLLTPRSVWLETHNYHHRNNSKLIGSSIGSFPMVSTAIWKNMNGLQRFMYRFIRHPMNMMLGYFTIFIYGMLISPFLRNPKKHWEAFITMAIHLFLILTIVNGYDWQTCLFVIVLPACISMAIGSYLFYVQHNFPDVQLHDRQKWNYEIAALSSSSLFDMPPLMHWFTGNIGYHYIHHLNSRIPFYNLPIVNEIIKSSVSPGVIFWTFSSIRDCCSLAIWDQDKHRMLNYNEAAEHST